MLVCCVRIIAKNDGLTMDRLRFISELFWHLLMSTSIFKSYFLKVFHLPFVVWLLSFFLYKKVEHKGL